MSPWRFRECVAALRISQRGLAALLGRDERQIRRWANGEGPIPLETAAWLERRARAMESDPPPRRGAPSSP